MRYTGLGETLEVEVEKADLPLRFVRDRALELRQKRPPCPEHC